MRILPLVCGLMLLGLFLVLAWGKTASFGGYWSSGRAASNHVNPFAAYPLTSHMDVSFHGVTHHVNDVNLNPPIVLLLLQPMSHLSLSMFASAWETGSLLCFLGSIALIMRHRPKLQLRQLLWLCTSSGVLETLFGGQIYFLLLLLTTCGWIALETRREAPASIAFGLLVAIKPLTIFVPLFLFLTGRRKIGALTMAFASVASLAPLAFYPREVFVQWFSTLRADNHWLIPSDVTIPAYFTRLQLSGVGFAVAAATVVCLSMLVAAWRPSVATTLGTGLCTTMLCAPLAWSTYVVMVAPMFVAQKWGKFETVTAVLLMLPASVMVSITAGFKSQLLAVATIYFGTVLLLFLCFARRLVRERQQITEAAAGIPVYGHQAPLKGKRARQSRALC